jgi:hypothetical protein
MHKMKVFIARFLGPPNAQKYQIGIRNMWNMKQIPQSADYNQLYFSVTYKR